MTKPILRGKQKLSVKDHDIYSQIKLSTSASKRVLKHWDNSVCHLNTLQKD